MCARQYSVTHIIIIITFLQLSFLAGNILGVVESRGRIRTIKNDRARWLGEAGRTRNIKYICRAVDSCYRVHTTHTKQLYIILLLLLLYAPSYITSYNVVQWGTCGVGVTASSAAVVLVRKGETRVPRKRDAAGADYKVFCSGGDNGRTDRPIMFFFLARIPYGVSDTSHAHSSWPIRVNHVV
jgi:hypothetical protein